MAAERLEDFDYKSMQSDRVPELVAMAAERLEDSDAKIVLARVTADIA